MIGEELVQFGEWDQWVVVVHFAFGLHQPHWCVGVRDRWLCDVVVYDVGDVGLYGFEVG